MGLFTAYHHVFRPLEATASIGWSTSPYEYEMGMADLTFGVLGFCAWYSARILVGYGDCGRRVVARGCGGPRLSGPVRQAIDQVPSREEPGSRDSCPPTFWVYSEMLGIAAPCRVNRAAGNVFR
jgi:hypothetical protein